MLVMAFYAKYLSLFRRLCHGQAANRILFQGRRTTDNLGDFLGDVRLTGAVVLATDGLDHSIRVFGRCLHRDPTAYLLAHRRVEETLEQSSPE